MINLLIPLIIKIHTRKLNKLNKIRNLSNNFLAIKIKKLAPLHIKKEKEIEKKETKHLQSKK